MTRIHISPTPGTTIAEDKDAARAAREGILLPAVRSGKSVTIDFGQTEAATQSFIHALIAQAIQELGEEALNLMRFSNCSHDVQELIITVVDYTLTARNAARPFSADRSRPKNP
jgi:hypothetical protein